MATTIGYTDFELEQETLKRKRAEAAALRRAVRTPKGEMVGKFYVAPHWSEQLAPVVAQVLAGREEKKLDEQETAMRERMQQGAAEWMQQRPQATIQSVPDATLQGPPMEGDQFVMGNRTVEPTQQQRLEHAQRGVNNPLTRALAAEYQKDILIKEPERQEAREFRAQEAEKQRTLMYQMNNERLQNQMRHYEMVAASAAATTEQRAAAAQAAEQTRRMIADNNAEYQRGLLDAKNREIDLRRELGEMKATIANNKPAKPVPESVSKVVRGAETAAEGLSTVHSSFDDKYGGVGGYVDKVSGTWNPFSGKEAEKAASWWKNYELQAALVERHEKFGTALSAGERDAWQKATISPGMKPNVIRENLKTRAELAEKFYEKVRSQAMTLGYPQVGDAFPTRQAGSEPVKVNSPAEAAKLPPGTEFITPDGQRRVRQ